MLKLHQGQDLLHECATCLLAFGVDFADHRHGECLPGGRNQNLDILADFSNPPRAELDIALGVAKLPANGVLIVDMSGAQPLQPGDVGFKPSLL
ncbi:MAG: hypothetical protein KDJ90_02910, partial [Nitratireductor sp.]|nr:hypothetical protein [Nitratireductor sp.]